jgi:tetratricopeptide (TPR) repeat protein
MLSKELGDDRSLALLYSLMGIYNMHKGKPLDGIKYSEVALERPRKIRDIELMAPIARGLCPSYIEVGEFRKTTEVAPEIIKLLEETHREADFFGAPFNAYSLLCVYYGTSLAMLGDFKLGETICEKGLHVGLTINHLGSLGPAELMTGLLFTAKGDGKKAIKHFQNAIKFMEEGEVFLVLGVAWTGLGCGYYYLGDLETARKYMEKGLKITIDAGVQWWLSFHYWNLSKTHFDLGDPKNARSYIEEALKASKKNSEKHIEGASWTLLGRILGKTDPFQIDKAEECIHKGINILEELKIKAWYSEGYLYLGEFYNNTGQGERALENLKNAEAEFRDMGMNYWLARTYAVYSDLYKKEGETSKAKENLTNAIEILKECGADGWVERYEKELASLS